jgi:hypothetical protein
MSSQFDPKRDMEALAAVSKPVVTHADQEMIKQAQAEHEEARRELRARVDMLKKKLQDDKEEWIASALQLVAPLWAVRWALNKNRGWILRIFSVTLDHWVFDSYTELFEVRKGGKLVAVKLFRWNGTHLEGRAHKWAARK